jgi:hypothetical protein
MSVHTAGLSFGFKNESRALLIYQKEKLCTTFAVGGAKINLKPYKKPLTP